MHAQSLHPETHTKSASRHRLLDWGDRLCCAALLAAALGGSALLGWYVWHMPPLR